MTTQLWSMRSMRSMRGGFIFRNEWSNSWASPSLSPKNRLSSQVTVHSMQSMRSMRWGFYVKFIIKTLITHIEHLFGLFFAQSGARIRVAVARGMALRAMGSRSRSRSLYIYFSNTS
jgi:hypothetical protein